MTWEKYYASAKNYYENNGDLKVPAKYIDENGMDLGCWIAQIRVFRKSGIKSRMLSAERIESLDKIGMIWDVLDYLWEENYAAAVRYHREYGNLDVPFDYIDSNGIRLGQWIQTLRSNRKGTIKSGYRELNLKQISRLDALGMIWGNKYEKQRNEAYQLLCEYYKKNGSFDIPVSYVTDNGVALGKWIRHQRDFFEKGKLSEERIEKLRNIGFVLEKSDPWEEKFQLAKAYFEEYDNLNIPAQYVVNGVWLSKWLDEQKLIAEGKRKKKHTAEQLEKLQSIGMQYGRIRSDEIWYERYNQAKAYYEENGNLDIPKGYISDGFGLGLWLDRQNVYADAAEPSARGFRAISPHNKSHFVGKEIQIHTFPLTTYGKCSVKKSLPDMESNRLLSAITLTVWRKSCVCRLRNHICTELQPHPIRFDSHGR